MSKGCLRLLCAVIGASAVVSAAGAVHPVAFWRQIAQDKYAVPAGSDVAALTSELADMLASPDPELRDEIGYSTLAAWIYQTRTIDDDGVRALADRLVGNLTAGVGEEGTDGVFKRSFSALTLSVIVARDNASPFLGADAFQRILREALAYLRAERDVRGYDAERGWMHSAAHTADLLKFLARSRHLDAASQTVVLDAIVQKLRSTAVVFTHGEDERFARAVLSIVNRTDFNRAAFAAWTSRTRPPRLQAKPSVAELSGAQNTKNLLTKLLVLLDVPQPSESARAAHDSVQTALEDLF